MIDYPRIIWHRKLTFVFSRIWQILAGKEEGLKGRRSRRGSCELISSLLHQTFILWCVVSIECCLMLVSSQTCIYFCQMCDIYQGNETIERSSLENVPGGQQYTQQYTQQHKLGFTSMFQLRLVYIEYHGAITKQEVNLIHHSYFSIHQHHFCANVHAFSNFKITFVIKHSFSDQIHRASRTAQGAWIGHVFEILFHFSTKSSF